MKEFRRMKEKMYTVVFGEIKLQVLLEEATWFVWGLPLMVTEWESSSAHVCIGRRFGRAKYALFDPLAKPVDQAFYFFALSKR